MNSTISLSARQPAPVIQGTWQLSRVMTWELRRFLSSRLFWIQALGFLSLQLVVTWALRAPERFYTSANGASFSGSVAGTSAWGILHTIPKALVLLVLLVPFITADAVTRDVQRRTHQLLMATALPNWAYIGGRYLVGLLMSLALAVLMLAGIVGTGQLLHLTAASYPPPDIGAILLVWAGVVLPAAVLVTGLGFAIATVFPRLSTLIKALIAAAWTVGALVVPAGLANTTPASWYVDWDPTGAVTAIGLLSQYSIGTLLRTPIDQVQNVLLVMEGKMPTVGSWLTAHLVLGAVGLVVVLLVPLAYKRSG